MRKVLPRFYVQKKIDFALVFAVNLKQLAGILSDVVPALHENAKFWVAYPKLTSKIYSELCRDYDWNLITNDGYECVCQVAIDSVWTAIRFKKTEIPVLVQKKRKKQDLDVLMQ